MITQLKLINFRNFCNKTISDLWEKNFIIGENGRWKTNILEALSILGNNSITKLNLENLVKLWENYFFIEIHDTHHWILSFSYEKDTKKRKFIINWKTVTGKKFFETSYKCISFSPIFMNLMYLSPSLRRDFLDEILSNSFWEYAHKYKEYKNILKHRNKVLQNIHEGKSQQHELSFWNEKFIESALEIYKYRYKVITFFQSSLANCLEYFNGKINKIEIHYLSKVSKDNSYQDILTYLEKNIQRDIILWKTPIGPHVDDFQIQVDGISLIQYASRWEVKSIIIWLKLLETVFIEKMTNKKPILLIDDLLSELDEHHKNMLLEKIKYYQVFISSITLKDEKKADINIKI